VRLEAERYGVGVAGSEIVGLVPKKAIEMAAGIPALRKTSGPELVLENRIAAAFASRGGLPEFLDAWHGQCDTGRRQARRAAAAAMAAHWAPWSPAWQPRKSAAFETTATFSRSPWIATRKPSST